ncbi:MAG: RnfABCDGE type electron transport complex subunit D [bacterium]|nr:RnfABCDGE type electron transport complex subunit D [bacterium]
MHYVTIVVLLVVALVANTGRGFPVNLAVAVLVAPVLDVAIKRFWLKKKPTLPLSAIITGLIIGTVSVNAPVSGVLIATFLAIGSKFIIRWNDLHIFNPAVFGVVIAQVFNPAAHGAVTHGSSQVVEGFGVGGFTVTLWLVPLLIFANWRARKLWTSIPFLTATALLFYFTRLASLNSFNTQGVMGFLEVLPYYFAFIIVSEPKTSPSAKKEQVLFGLAIAVFSVLPLIVLGSYSHLGALAAVLLGNLIYVAYRTRKITKSLQK